MDPSPDDDTPSKHSKARQHAESATDDKLEEFLDVMRPRTAKGPLWANGEGKPRPGGPIVSAEPPLPESVAQSPPGEDEAGKDEPLSDLEWMRRRMSSKVDVAHRAFEQDDEGMEKSLNEAAPAVSHFRLMFALSDLDTGTTFAGFPPGRRTRYNITNRKTLRSQSDIFVYAGRSRNVI